MEGPRNWPPATSLARKTILKSELVMPLPHNSLVADVRAPVCSAHDPQGLMPGLSSGPTCGQKPPGWPRCPPASTGSSVPPPPPAGVCLPHEVPKTERLSQSGSGVSLSLLSYSQGSGSWPPCSQSFGRAPGWEGDVPKGREVSPPHCLGSPPATPPSPVLHPQPPACPQCHLMTDIAPPHPATLASPASASSLLLQHIYNSRSLSPGNRA